MSRHVPGSRSDEFHYHPAALPTVPRPPLGATGQQGQLGGNAAGGATLAALAAGPRAPLPSYMLNTDLSGEETLQQMTNLIKRHAIVSSANGR